MPLKISDCVVISGRSP